LNHLALSIRQNGPNQPKKFLLKIFQKAPPCEILFLKLGYIKEKLINKTFFYVLNLSESVFKLSIATG
tara:strand:- start:96 stop:299 length:204 start_codon:yes stop_codon:yes gene_type:complete